MSDGTRCIVCRKTAEEVREALWQSVKKLNVEAFKELLDIQIKSMPKRTYWNEESFLIDQQRRKELGRPLLQRPDFVERNKEIEEAIAILKNKYEELAAYNEEGRNDIQRELAELKSELAEFESSEKNSYRYSFFSDGSLMKSYGNWDIGKYEAAIELGYPFKEDEEKLRIYFTHESSSPEHAKKRYEVRLNSIKKSIAEKERALKAMDGKFSREREKELRLDLAMPAVIDMVPIRDEMLEVPVCTLCNEIFKYMTRKHQYYG